MQWNKPQRLVYGPFTGDTTGIDPVLWITTEWPVCGVKDKGWPNGSPFQLQHFHDYGWVIKLLLICLFELLFEWLRTFSEN